MIKWIKCNKVSSWFNSDSASRKHLIL